MVSRATDAVPNIALYNLRDAAGQTQHDVAEALNALGATHHRGIAVSANQVSRWERGITHPSGIHRQLLAEHFGVSLEELGLTRPRITSNPGPGNRPREPFSIDSPPVEHVDKPHVAHSQAEWREVRRLLNLNRVRIARTAAQLYDPDVRVGGSGLIAHPSWLLPTPLDLDEFRIKLTGLGQPTVTGSEDFSARMRPLADVGRRYQRYSQAVRDLDHPRLFENKFAWRLVDIDWADPENALTFSSSTYFEGFDVAETLAHEMAAQHLSSDGAKLLPASWRGLNFRRELEDPFTLPRRPATTSTDTLTLRVDRDGATFVLHDRSANRVATAGGMLHIMPAGVFQPSSIMPAAQATDFDLWHNIMREYSEEFLGNAEHGGDGQPADYGAEPLSSFGRAKASGGVRVYCLGVALDALTLWGELLTVAVYDGPVYDRLFAEMVHSNDEGTIVTTGTVRPTHAIPFTRHVIDELLDSDRLAPAAAGILELAWQHRAKILERS
ncbi:helix-turn-helix transcriptional regulator [Longispora sp. NPDC051575]|uniref:helix-turn-helix domain-containing protein n=1 Tax=Longispora sp. NPDC051575 TaxID=3154943 RepID=UPI00342F6170